MNIMESAQTQVHMHNKQTRKCDKFNSLILEVGTACSSSLRRYLEDLEITVILLYSGDLISINKHDLKNGALLLLGDRGRRVHKFGATRPHCDTFPQKAKISR